MFGRFGVGSVLAAVLVSGAWGAQGGVPGDSVAPAVTVGSRAAESGVDAKCSHARQDAVELFRVTDSREVREAKRVLRWQIASGAVVVRGSESDLDFDAIKVFETRNDRGRALTVTVPLVSDSLSLFSGLTVVYGDGVMSSYAETHVTRNADKNFQALVFQNGEKVRDSEIGVPWVANDKVLEEIKHPGSVEVPMPRGWGAKVGCVAATLGVSWWVANTIVGLCGATCSTATTNPVSAGICAACITGIVAVGGGALTAVYNCFKL